MDCLELRPGADNCGRPVLNIRLRRQGHPQEGGPLQRKYADGPDRGSRLRLGLKCENSHSRFLHRRCARRKRRCQGCPELGHRMRHSACRDRRGWDWDTENDGREYTSGCKLATPGTFVFSRDTTDTYFLVSGPNSSTASIAHCGAGKSAYAYLRRLSCNHVFDD